MRPVFMKRKWEYVQENVGAILLKSFVNLIFA